MTLEGRNYMRRVLSDKEMKDAWKERFKKERKKKYARQEDFAEAMQHEGHATMKSTVGRWENIGLFGGFCGRDSGIGPAQRAKTTIWN